MPKTFDRRLGRRNLPYNDDLCKDSHIMLTVFGRRVLTALPALNDYRNPAPPESSSASERSRKTQLPKPSEITLLETTEEEILVLRP